GYKTRVFVLPALAVGAPHRRDRAFVVAYADGEQDRRGEQPRIQSNIGANGQNVANTGGAGCEECDIAAKSNKSGYGSGGSPEKFMANAKDEWVVRRNGEFPNDEESGGSGCYHSRRAQKNDGRKWRTVESGLGGVLDGLSDWLDGCRWPALLGQPQYEWEPPRVAVGIKNRVPRLKALGNAVVPQQVFPILAAIKAVHDSLKGGAS